MNHNMGEFDRYARAYVCDITLRRGYPPTIVETSDGLLATTDEVRVRASLNRLAAGRVLVLQRDTGELLMPNPFSVVPAPFLVETKGYACYGNCIWDALGTPAMLHQNARITPSLGWGDLFTTLTSIAVPQSPHTVSA